MALDDRLTPPDEDLRLVIIEAIRRVRLKIRWRPGKDVQHLVKRIHFGHLAAGTTIAQYEAIINAVINDDQANVYVFRFNDELYPTVVAIIENKKWLVMIGLDGTMETAFPPSDPDTYLSDSAYLYVAVLEELMK